MHKGKSIACCEHRIPASSSSSDNDIHESLGANQEKALETHALTHTLPYKVCCCNVEGGPFTMEGQPFNVRLFCFDNDMFNYF